MTAMTGRLRVRPFSPADGSDRAAIRRICCDTGARGEPVEALFSDRRLFADVLTRYYTDFEPETTFVAVSPAAAGGDEEVVGYLTGCVHPWRRRLVQTAILAFAVVPRGLARLLAGRYDARDRRFLAWSLLRGSRETPKAPRRAAHFHFNLSPAWRQKGAGLRLYLAFLGRLEEAVRAGLVERVYGQIQTGPDRRDARLFERFGYRRLDRRTVTKFGDGRGDDTVWLDTYVRQLTPGESLELRPGGRA